MEWVAIDIDIAGDPAVHRMAESLKIRVPEVVGLLTLTFGGMAKHSPDGRIAAVPDVLLETWAAWHGKRGRFATLFRAELCDTDGVVRAWEKYNGRNIRRAKAASERTRIWREKSERERALSANGMHNGAHNVRRTGQDRTGQDITALTTGRVRVVKALPSWVRPTTLRWRSSVGRISEKAIYRELAEPVLEHGDAKMDAAIVAYAKAKRAADKAMKLEWFAEDVVTWVIRGEEAAQPIYDHATGELTEYGERMTRP